MNIDFDLRRTRIQHDDKKEAYIYIVIIFICLRKFDGSSGG